jgi:hypothetical protein
MRFSILLGVLLVAGTSTGCVVRARSHVYTETEPARTREVYVVHHNEPARTREVHVVHHEEPARAREVHVVDGSGGRCPPGHRWSDGKCHSTGKGRD